MNLGFGCCDLGTSVFGGFNCGILFFMRVDIIYGCARFSVDMVFGVVVF